ncbi:hypothetical protein SDC9_137214 [bioreactor metagenome]|uniref:DUF6329 domain-containing protein n=1 Tax=bioreactor metagenome TaxID=1076179 RepID=A0A645DLD3_9ZZZZ
MIEPQPCTIEAIYEMDHDTFENFCNGLTDNNIFITDLNDYMYIDSAGVIHGLLALDTESGDGVLIDSQGYDYARYTAFMPNIKSYIDKQTLLVVEQIVKDACEISDECEYAFDCDIAQKYYGFPVTENNGIGGMLLRELQKREEFLDIEVEEDVFYLKLKNEFKQEQTPLEPTLGM